MLYGTPPMRKKSTIRHPFLLMTLSIMAQSGRACGREAWSGFAGAHVIVRKQVGALRQHVAERSAA
jgi:hypothetical protein